MKGLTGTKNKELFLIDGATHIQTYWKPEYVEQVVNKLKEFYESRKTQRNRKTINSNCRTRCRSCTWLY